MQKNFLRFLYKSRYSQSFTKTPDIFPYKLLFFSREFAINLLLLSKKIPALNRDNYWL